MKKNMFFSLIFALLFSFAFIACDTDRDRDDDALDETTDMERTPTTQPYATEGTKVTFWDENRDYVYTDRTKYKDETKRAIDKVDNQIDRLEDKADEATGPEKERLNQRIAELKQKRDNIETRMNDFDNITENNWESFKSDMNTAWNDVEDSWNSLVRDMDIDVDDDQM